MKMMKEEINKAIPSGDEIWSNNMIELKFKLRKLGWRLMEKIYIYP